MKVALLYFYIVTTTLTCSIILTACWVYFTLKIRINTETKFKWIIILIGMMLRWSLSTYMLVSNNYEFFPTKYAINWVIEEIHFMMLLQLFVTVIGSWYTSSQLNNHNVLDEPLNIKMFIVQKRQQINQQFWICFTVYTILTFIVAILVIVSNNQNVN